ncbi:MAG: acetate--CoA ligase family protein [Patescibacteria group bacterium]|nr:acetate--CoA ligase family protein [Patescibacteria group bacterium]
MNLTTLFNPKSVAIIGAADDPKKLGYVIMANLLAGAPRKIYPVNPAFKKVLKLPCLPSVKNIKGAIDLAIIAVKPEIVPAVLADCGEKKIPHVIIITAGFKEIGGAGAEREKELKKIAAQYKINLIGPNCLGVMDAHSALDASFGNGLPAKGNLAFVSQSGAVGTATLDWAKKNNVGFSKFISIGNEAGATENDFLEFLGTDKDTRAILMYLEAVTDGQRFMKLVEKISKIKPVVVLKAGRTERGLAAVASHTGSLAPSHEIFKTACKQSGAILVDSLGAMFNLAKLFNSGFISAPNDWAILTNGGGPSIVMSDAIESSANLRLAVISETTKNKLRAVLPASAALGNPIDIIGDALADRYEAALKILTAEKTIGGLVVLLTPQKMTEIKKTAELIVKYKKSKPIMPMFIGGTSIAPAEKVFGEHGLVNFLDQQSLVSALSALAPAPKKHETKHAAAKTFLRQLSFTDGAKLLKEVGLSVVGEFVSKKEWLIGSGGKVNFPAVMKVVSAQVIHKSDAGGVKINIKDIAEAKKAWDDMSRVVPLRVPGAKIDGFLIQPMTKGREVIVGMKRDAVFGPVILFGLGGIFVEAIKDVAMRIAPVGEPEALKMLDEIKGAVILKGARGEDSVDRTALAKIIVAISRLAQAHPEIKEIDLNPVMATPDGAKIVDARILV